MRSTRNEGVSPSRQKRNNLVLKICSVSIQVYNQ